MCIFFIIWPGKGTISISVFFLKILHYPFFKKYDCYTTDIETYVIFLTFFMTKSGKKNLKLTYPIFIFDCIYN